MLYPHQGPHPSSPFLFVYLDSPKITLCPILFLIFWTMLLILLSSLFAILTLAYTPSTLFTHPVQSFPYILDHALPISSHSTLLTPFFSYHTYTSLYAYRLFIHPVHSSSYIWTPRKSLFVQSFSLYFGPCSTHIHSFYSSHSSLLSCHTYTSLFPYTVFIHPVHSSSYIWSPRKSLFVQSFPYIFHHALPISTHSTILTPSLCHTHTSLSHYTVFIHPVHSSSYIWTPRKSLFVQSFLLFCHTHTSLYPTRLFIHPVHSSSYIWSPRKSLFVQSFSLYFGPCSTHIHTFLFPHSSLLFAILILVCSPPGSSSIQSIPLHISAHPVNNCSSNPFPYILDHAQPISTHYTILTLVSYPPGSSSIQSIPLHISAHPVNHSLSNPFPYIWTMLYPYPHIPHSLSFAILTLVCSPTRYSSIQSIPLHISTHPVNHCSSNPFPYILDHALPISTHSTLLTPSFSLPYLH